MSNLIFLTIEVAEIIPYRHEKPYENVIFLTDLYLKKGWSLRRISEELGCSKTTVRKKLVEAGIEVKEQASEARSRDQNKFHELVRVKKLKEEFSGISSQLEALTKRLANLPVDVPANEIYKSMRLLNQKRDQIKTELLKNQQGVLGQVRPVDLPEYLDYLSALKNAWTTAQDNPEAKEKIIKSIIAKISLGANEVLIDYWMGKERFNQVLENF